MEEQDKAEHQPEKGVTGHGALDGGEVLQRLLRAERRLRVLDAVLSSITDYVYMFDREFKYLYASPRAAEFFGYSPEELHGKTGRDVGLSEEIMAPFEKKLGKVFATGEVIRSEIALPGEDAVNYYECIISPAWWEDGKVGAAVVSKRDITDRKRMEETIRRQASHDPLTDLPNRTLFMDHLNLELAKARRSRKMLAVLFLDLDRFKNINDTLGHSTGDLLLMAVADRLKSCVREVDTVARIGGDEFNILLTNISHPDDIAVIVKKLIAVFEESFVIEGHMLHETASIGISIYPDDGDDTEVLLKNADIAMYHAKDQGRNNYQFYNPAINIMTLRRLLLENNLRQMINRGELVLYYQPQLNIGTGKIVCVEALARWQHPELGVLNPPQFIPLAEETGIITSIDEWVLSTACAQAKSWQRAGYHPICVTVNLSRQQFQKPDLVEIVSSILKDTGLNPALLHLEVTENTAMQDVNHTLDALKRLADLGVKASIDDFGTGYSSLSCLKKLPVQKLKIDKSLIQGLKEDKDDRAIVNALITMAHNLNLGAVAEGVETNEQLSFLSSSRCDEMQGFLFSEPLPSGKFEKLAMLHK
ncbi:MAG TPA: EAL domain-containing protein [Dissulfurispiraceae bacterium]